MALDLNVLQKDITYFKGLTEKPANGANGIDRTFMEVMSAMKDKSKLTIAERTLIEEWIRELDAKKEYFSDETAKSRLAELKKELDKNIDPSLSDLHKNNPTQLTIEKDSIIVNENGTHSSSIIATGESVRMLYPLQEKILEIQGRKMHIIRVSYNGKDVWIQKSDLPAIKDAKPEKKEISNGVKEVKEALSEINPENLEKAVTISEKFINIFPDGQTKFTLRGVHGAIIFDILRSAGHHLIMQNGQITIVPKPGVEVVNLQEKLQTLVNTSRISLDTIKLGMLYSSPSFAKYAEMKKTKDLNGKDIIDPRASTADFITYLSDLQRAGNKSGDIESILKSQSLIAGVNMPQAVGGFQDMNQIGTWMEKNPSIIANGITGGSGSPQTQKVQGGSSREVSSETPRTPPKPGTAEYYAKVVGTEAGKFGADTGKNVGTALGAFGNTIGGFISGVGKEAGPLGAGIAVVGLIYAGYKLLTGQVRGHSGFFWSVVALLGGSGIMAGLKRFGIDIPDITAGDALEKGKKTAEEVKKAITGGDEKTEKKDEETLSQKKASDIVRNSTEIKTILDPAKLTGKKQNASLDMYLRYINTDLKDKNANLLYSTTNKDHSIFKDTNLLDPSIVLPPEFNPVTFKTIMRMYLTGQYIAPTKINENINEKTIVNSMKKLTIQDPTLAQAVELIQK